MATAMKDQKLFCGPRVRRLRRERALTQVRMAEELGISTSYLNLIERNQRPVTAQLLIRLAEVYDVNLRDFAGGEEAEAFADLSEVFSDPLLRGREIAQQELKDVAAAGPEVSRAILALYQAYRESLTRGADLAERMTSRGEGGDAPELRDPMEEVRDFLRLRNNHFPDLEARAEDLHVRAKLSRDDLLHGLRGHLLDALGIGVTIMPVDLLPQTLRLYDRHRRRLVLSEMLPESGRVFQVAYQIALIEHGEAIDAAVKESGIEGGTARRLCRAHLASYFAGAVMMPYERFLQAAETLRYDVEVLSRRFGASYEQVCHRLTTLHRPGARGVPFFMVRLDAAGNVTKRFSSGGFRFARLGGSCPRWDIHRAFQTPGRILSQMVEMPDGSRYVTFVRTVSRAGLGNSGDHHPFAVALGFEAAYAQRVVYADGFDPTKDSQVTPIGLGCRLCERADCTARAFPPLTRPLIVDEHRRELAPFMFLTD